MLQAKIKALSPAQRLATVFYAATGLLLLAFLPLSGYPPHVGFLGIFSLIGAYSLFTKRSWAPWLVFVLLITNSVFSLYTLYAVGLSNIIVALTMIGYALLTWLFTYIAAVKRYD
ncbi:MAG: hypothetical protein NWE93_07330 [Candidatus Bathyarchaeota archaeon]|nr:hypothetical protein [Candidatus Bathyarchaeota archaeon]